MVQNVRLKYQTQRRSFLKRLPNLQETLTIPHLVDGLTNCRNHFCHFSHLGEEIFLQGLKQNFGQMASPARFTAVSLFLFYFSFKKKGSPVWYDYALSTKSKWCRNGFWFFTCFQVLLPPWKVFPTYFHPSLTEPPVSTHLEVSFSSHLPTPRDTDLEPRIITTGNQKSRWSHH